MAEPKDIDGILVQWGDRLFYPGNRMVRERRQPKLAAMLLRDRAAVIRSRIQAMVVRRAPQVMVKVTGGGRGMKAIAAHFRYISKNGRLEIEDELGNVERGRRAVRDMADDWRYGGSLIEDTSHRREAFNIMLSMPAGTDPLAVKLAAREFAQVELADHKFVMVLHDHQANPHVHLSVRAESKHGKRLNPRKADLQRWRETFAEKLRGWGIDAEASRQATRGVARNYSSIWQGQAASRGGLHRPLKTTKSGAAADASRAHARTAWSAIAEVLRDSPEHDDRALALAVEAMLDPGKGRSRSIGDPVQRAEPPTPARAPSDRSPSR